MENILKSGLWIHWSGPNLTGTLLNYARCVISKHTHPKEVQL